MVEVGADVSFRPVEPDDLPALQEIRRSAFAPIFQSFRSLVGTELGPVAFARSDAEQAAHLDQACRVDSGQQVLVASAGQAIVGFVCFSMNPETGMGEIGLNAVRPDHSGRGIGTRMYEEVLARMKDMGVAVVEVSTGGDPSHAAARRAYEKVGFGPTIPSVTFYKRL